MPPSSHHTDCVSMIIPAGDVAPTSSSKKPHAVTLLQKHRQRVPPDAD
ncbi:MULTISPECIES: hypothetical protein [Cupriavidus]|nr:MULTISPECIES: hypothetical protein [Cupriavidus]